MKVTNRLLLNLNLLTTGLLLIVIAVLMSGCGQQVGPMGPPGIGIQGEPGKDGEPGTTLEVIELCPDITGDGFKEHLFKINDELFGVYSDKKRVFLVKLLRGRAYVTTDGRDCQFEVTETGEVLQ
jgi:hypothetical protein